MSRHEIKFPGESENYRKARNALLERELELIQTIKANAELRAKLPLGGKLKEDYELQGPNGPVKFSELFESGKDSLIVYSFMYPVDKEQPCPMCNSLIDGFQGNWEQVSERVNFAVFAKSPYPKLQAWGERRGWTRVKLYSTEKISYNADYHAENEKWGQIPALNVFKKTPEGIFHHYALEALYCRSEGEPKHADLLWPLWNLLDLTPEGRGKDWYPKLEY